MSRGFSAQECSKTIYGDRKMKKRIGMTLIGLLIAMALIAVAVMAIPAKADQSPQYSLILPETDTANLDDYTYQWLTLTQRDTMKTVTAATGVPGATTLVAAGYFATEDATFYKWGWRFPDLQPGTYIFTVYGSTDTTADSGDTFLKNGVFDWNGRRITGDPRTY
jgi:hypothetical protein